MPECGDSYIGSYPTAPSLKKLTSSFGTAPPQALDSLQHLGSFLLPLKRKIKRIFHRVTFHRPFSHLSYLCPGKCHVESFNFMLGDGLARAVADLDPIEFLIPETKDRVSLWITDVTIQRPSVVPGAVGAVNREVCAQFCT